LPPPQAARLAASAITSWRRIDPSNISNLLSATLPWLQLPCHEEKEGKAGQTGPKLTVPVPLRARRNGRRA
jgi:hypothetical protein